MYQVISHSDLQVLLIPRNIPQVCHLQFFHLILLIILSLYRHMYEVGIHPDLQVLCQTVSYLIIIVHLHHMYQF